VKHLTLRASTRQLALVAIACAIAAAAVLGVFGYSRLADASSHREAPFIGGDPQADATDVYAFRSPDKPDTVTLIANYVPLEVAPAGPNFYKFGDQVLYEINIDNDGDARDDLSYQFRFKNRINNGNTFLYNTGPITSLKDRDLNQEQFYSVSVLKEGEDPSREGKVIAENLQVAPANVGPVSYPGGYADVANEAIYDIGNGIKVFAGPRDDPFFADLGGIFDLLGGITGEDYLAGLNTHSIAIQVPIKTLKGPEDSIIGVRTTSYRKSLSVLRPIGSPDSQNNNPSTSEGPWVQLSRLDIPLVNELVIPLSDKNRWNGSKPQFDSQFLSFVQNPEPAALIDNILLPDDDVPPNPRDDIVTIFLTGIPGLNKPEDVKPSSQLRLNMAVNPTASPNRLGVLGGDNAGFPNGRRLADDVVDIELRALAGATPFTPDFNKPPNSTLGDGANANDVPFLDSFPYVAEPHDYEDLD
jgi:Domain of unknown function (DUF4331)